MKRLIFFLVIILSSLEVSHGIFGKKKNRGPKRPPDNPWGEENIENEVGPSSVSRELLELEQQLNGDDPDPYPMDPYFPYGPGKCPRQQWGCPCATNEESESGETGCWGKKKGKNKKGKGKKAKKKKEKKKKEKNKKEKKKKCKSSFWKRTTPDPNESIYDNV